MIQSKDGFTTITCDKCNHSSTTLESQYNEVFYSEGWGLFSNAKKYKHMCQNCIPKKYRRTTYLTVLILLISFLYSCNNDGNHIKHRYGFILKEARIVDKNHCEYIAEYKGWKWSSLYFIDTPNKFNIGDTLFLTAKQK